MNPDVIRKIIHSGNVMEDQPLSGYTTFLVGGPARIFVTPGNEAELADLLRLLSENSEEYFILGNGSNLLVSDRGFSGIVINLGRNQNRTFSELSHEQAGDDVLITAGAGVKMGAIGKLAEELSLTGFECLSGIPGSIGGACVMNAGAYGGELKDVFYSGKALDRHGNIIDLTPETMNFGYRRSSVSDRDLIVTQVVIRLTKGDPVKISERMQELSSRRREKQPLEFPSAGSTFKRPEGYFAGKLIEDSGLRGYRVGGASVSTKHCGFVVNDRNACAGDIYQLICYIQDKVFRDSGVRLEPEIRFLGEF